MAFTSPTFTKPATAHCHSVAISSTEIHINWLRNIERDVEIHFRCLKWSMAVTAPFLKKLNAVLKFLTKYLYRIYISPTFGEVLMVGYAEKDGQTWFAPKPSSYFLNYVSLYQLYGNSRSLVLSLTQPKCCSYLFPRLVTVPSVWCCLTDPKLVPSSWDASVSRWHRVAHVISLPHSLWTWGM
jgi:hypothetical protein